VADHRKTYSAEEHPQINVQQVESTQSTSEKFSFSMYQKVPTWLIFCQSLSSLAFSSLGPARRVLRPSDILIPN